MRQGHFTRFSKLLGGLAVVVVLVVSSGLGWAATQTSGHSVNVTATVYGPAPSTPAVITDPATGLTVSVTPLVVSGTCGPGLLVRVFDNNVLAGTTDCGLDGRFSVNITLQLGHNSLTALNYDTLDQAGPASSAVIVTVIQPSTGRTRTPGSPGSGGQSGQSGQPQPNPGSGSSPGQPRSLLTATQVHATWLLFAVSCGLLLVGGWVKHRRRKQRSSPEGPPDFGTDR